MRLTAPPLPLVREFLPQFRYLLPRLEFLEAVFPGVVPTSWYRDQAQNLRAGGARFSQHRLGFAVDWDLPDRSDYQAFASLAGRLGLVAVVESDHVHTQLFRAGTIPTSVFPV